MARLVNLVFQGGGVKGLSYAGAYSQMPDSCRVNVVGGASAGAIAAALIACGMSKADLESRMRGLDLETLLDPTALDKMKELKAIAQEIAALAGRASGGNLGMLSVAGFWRRNNRSIKRHMNSLLADYGFFVADGLKAWLIQQIGENTKFRDITAVKDLRIVASDIGRRELRPFSKTYSADKSIVEAVVASASIPFFFHPANVNGLMVDGGMLSNFPLRMFETDPYPTVGFRLMPIVAPNTNVNNFPQFLRALVDTLLDAHDKAQPVPHKYCENPIYFPSGITAVDFNLSTEQKGLLLQAGVAAGAQVKWMEFSSEVPLLKGIDTKPHVVVTRTIENAELLEKAYCDESRRPETLEDDTRYTVRIDANGDVLYETGQPWLGSRSLLEFRSSNEPINISMADLNWTIAEIQGSTEVPLPRFPLVNEPSAKGFVYAFVPPISHSDEPRKFIARWSKQGECTRTLVRGEPDIVSYAVMQRANRHRVRLELILLIDPNLGYLVPSQPNGMQTPTRAEVAVGQTAYVRWTIKKDWFEVNGQCAFDTVVAKAVSQ